jgi:hypothetical protein
LTRRRSIRGGARIATSGETIARTQQIVHHPQADNEILTEYAKQLRDIVATCSRLEIKYTLVMEGVSAALGLSEELLKTSKALLRESQERVRRLRAAEAFSKQRRVRGG